MSGTVPALSIAFMGLSCIMGFALPLALLFYFRKKQKADISPFFIGCAVMLVFALILEGLINQAVLLRSPIGPSLRSNPLCYALYGGLMAGLFEETGRFIAFKTILKKRLEKDQNALMYGAGHGGLEAAFIIGLGMVNAIIYSVTINSGQTGALTSHLTGAQLAQLNSVFKTLIETPSWQFLLGPIERIFALTLQISLSVVVFFAAKRKKSRFLLPAAIGIHAAVNAVAGYMSRMAVPMLLAECVIAVFAAMTALFANYLWKQEKGEGQPAA